MCKDIPAKTGQVTDDSIDPSQIMKKNNVLVTMKQYAYKKVEIKKIKTIRLDDIDNSKQKRCIRR